MLSLRHLDHIAAVVEAGSLTAASEVLGISPPALSKSIRTLEDQLGIPLFDRKGRVLMLTRFGQEFTAEARRMVAQAGSLEMRALSVARGEAGTIYVGVGPIPRQVALARAFSRVVRERTSLRIDVCDGTWPSLSEKLLDYTLDCIVMDPDDLSQSAHRDKFRIERLKPLEVGVYCRPGHPLLKQEAVTIEDLISSRWASPRFPEHYKQELRIKAEAAGLPASKFVKRLHQIPDIHIEDLYACLEFIRDTDHVAPAPIIMARRSLELGSIVRLAPFEFQTQMAVITHAERSLSSAASLLIDQIIATTNSL